MTQAYTLSGPGQAQLPLDTIVSPRSPVSTDLISPSGIPYPVDQPWFNSTTQASYVYKGSGNWVVDSLVTGSVDTLSDGTTAVTPLLGNVQLLGTANQITVTSGSNRLTWTLPSAITAPGSLTTTTTNNATTTMTAGTGITSTTGNIVATAGAVNAGTTMTAATGITATSGNILASGGDIVASRSAAGVNNTIQVTNSDNTSGTSNAGVEIAVGGASSGDPYLSFQISGVGASTMTMGLDNSAADTLVISNSNAIGTSNALTLTQAGALGATTSVTAGTTVTATLGNITATNGDVVMSTIGNGVVIKSGANARIGQATLVNGTVTVANTSVTANTRVFVTRVSKAASTAMGTLEAVPTANTNIVITALNPTDASTQTNDVSIVDWMLVEATP